MKEGKPTRVYPDFVEWCDDIAIERIKNNLEKEKISPKEVTRMILNAPSILNLEKELTSFKRKTNVE